MDNKSSEVLHDVTVSSWNVELVAMKGKQIVALFQETKALYPLYLLIRIW